MKILLIWPYFPPDPGAASARGRAFFDVLRKNNTVRALSFANNKKSNQQKIEPRLKANNSIINIIHNILSIKSVRKEFKPDVIIASSPSPIIPLLALSARSHKTMIVLDSRDLNITKGKKTLVERIAYEKSDLILCTTKTHKKLIITKYKINPQKVIITPNGVSISSKRPEKPKKKYHLVHSGSINPERAPKKLAKFLNNASKSNLKTVVVGIDDQNTATQIFLSSIDQTSLKNIDLVKEKTEDESIEIIAGAQIGIVFLSGSQKISYQLPVKIFDYISNGLPIALYTTDLTCESAQFIKKNNIGIVCSEIEALLTGIKKLFEDTQKFKLLSENCYETAKNHDRKTFIENTEREIRNRI